VSKMFHDVDYTCGLLGKLHLTACHPSVCKTTERRIDDGYDMFHWSHDANSYWPTNEYLHWPQEKAFPTKRKLFPIPSTFKLECRNAIIKQLGVWKAIKIRTLQLIHSKIFKQIYRACGIPTANFVQGELDQRPYFQQLEYKEGTNSGSMKIKYNAADMTGMDQKLIRAAFWVMVELIDVQVGRLISVLEASGVLENTLVPLYVRSW
jgi:arylsulfatase